jgi:hypothetical protein
MIRLTKQWGLAVAVLTLMAAGSNAQGGIALSLTGLANPATTITFSEVQLASGTQLTNQYAGLGVTFAGSYYYPQDVDAFSLSGVSGPNLGNFQSVEAVDPPSTTTNPFSISFTTPQTSAAFALVSQPGSVTFTTFLGGSMVETAALGTDTTAPNFYVFSGNLIDKIQISVTSINGGPALVDNIQLGVAAVPEPSTLISGGIAALFSLGHGWRRRRKARLAA